MRWVAAFGRFWWEFVIGDDWLSAFAVVGAIGITALAATRWEASWIVLPVAVVAILYASLRRAIRG